MAQIYFSLDINPDTDILNVRVAECFNGYKSANDKTLYSTSISLHESTNQNRVLRNVLAGYNVSEEDIREVMIALEEWSWSPELYYSSRLFTI